MLVFEILLLVAIVAGIFIGWDRRSGDDRRSPSRGGRRAADAPDNLAEPTSG